MCNYAGCYAAGIGTEKNIQKAFQLCIHASRLGNGDAFNMLGDYYKNIENDNKKAAEFYWQGANLGSSQAINNLAVCYKLGIGVEKNVNESAKLYAIAASLKDDVAINNLGFAHTTESGLKRDAKMEFELYQKASSYGNGNALNNLAGCYFSGRGVVKDINMAKKIYKQAVDAGCEISLRGLVNCYEAENNNEKNAKTIIELYLRIFKSGKDEILKMDYKKVNKIIDEYKGELDVLRFGKNSVDDTKCAVCYRSDVRRAIYRCFCNPNTRICCTCYLKIIDSKCPCCKKTI